MLAGWRRYMIMEKLRAKRHVKISELAEQFHVSERTVRNDIVRLSEIYPIYTTQGRGTGGVHILETYRTEPRRLTDAQAHFLEKVIPELKPEDRKIAESILLDFAPL